MATRLRFKLKETVPLSAESLATHSNSRHRYGLSINCSPSKNHVHAGVSTAHLEVEAGWELP